ncbi:HGGxSTG domain-containing protein [Alicyclobacillus kakegawensis]|uniref:HGGxSTG domain-containing protein n=1 Tax=Alicyclobacillus kakegawensis TaxID=392012 RepID=UPI00082BD740|nr:HGGxSTG domain-containing protein [Alicyclobacillus kakegawensis]
MPKCGAKTRKGTPCQNNAMANGRCRMHGGKSTGPPPEKMRGNKHALVTGEYETIWLDTLDDTERVLFHVVDTDALAQLDNEIRLTDIRERRMLQRIQRLQLGKDMMPIQVTHRKVKGPDGEEKTEEITMQPALDTIRRIEEALTRVQERKTKLIELKHRILSGGRDDTSSLDGLVKAIRESGGA